MAKEPTYQNLYEGLLSLDPPTGSPPKTRMMDAYMARDMITRAIRMDMQQRDLKRSRLKGLVDGNPPYKASDLIAAGRGDECNVNWRIAKYFLEQARGMVYDIFSEAKTYATIELDSTLPNYDEKSRIATEGFQRLLEMDVEHDFTHQQSQGQMVMFGCGPQLFDDDLDWRTISIESRSLFVPEMAPSNVNRWEWAAVVLEHTPDRLYSRIQNAPAAQRRGWNVPATRRCIMNAHPLTRTGVMYQNWSWHQDILKNNTYAYWSDQSKKCRIAYFFFREFPEDGEEEGRITKAIIDLDTFSALDDQGKLEYLYLSERQYGSWHEVIHPMYWNHDINGFHHSVTGLGIEMYSALEYENRLLCKLANDAFAPRIFFKPTTASDREKMSIAHLGQYAVVPAYMEMLQQHIQPYLQEGIAMHREVQNIVTANLSQFRNQSMVKQQGNPATATQINYEASEAAKMGKTQLTRIYEQHDWLYGEQYRRATSPKMTSGARGGKEAKEFMDWCAKRGVTAEELRKVESVMATRVVGQGSSYMRQQALEFLLGLVAMLPESGRANLIKQVIASRAGQTKVREFYPEQEQDDGMLNQLDNAQQQVVGMKNGVPPVITPTQNPLLYAQTFLKAADDAAQAVQQGANPHEAVAFLDVALPATEQHLARMSQDKSREAVVKGMSEKIQELASFKDEVSSQLQKAQEQAMRDQQKASQAMQGVDSETQVGMAKVQSKHQLDLMKLQGNMALKKQKQDADLALKARGQAVDHALKDATTAHGLRLNRIQTTADIQLEKQKAAAKPKPSSNGKG